MSQNMEETQTDLELQFSQLSLQGQPSQFTELPSVTNSKNNTFNALTIVPIIRHVKIHDFCNAIYSTLHKIPLAVHQFIDNKMINGSANREGKDFYRPAESVGREDKFYVGPQFYDATKAYKSMSYDKGHMAPASNYLSNQSLLNATYTYANCIPQDSYFNRGSWKNLESYGRNLLRNALCETLQIISGPVFYSGVGYENKYNLYVNTQIVMMEDGIVVPPKCYKIIKANLKDKSYVSAFVMENRKFIDNEFGLSSFVVEIDRLEKMTGLTFNLGKYQGLQKLDPVGMSKTMGDLHLQFYTKLYKNGKTIGDMNGARIQGFMYKCKVDINSVPKENREYLVEKQIFNITNEDGWGNVKAKSRKKINCLLGLHKDAKEMDALTEDTDKRIEQMIEDNLEGCKTEIQKQYHRYISLRIYKNNYGYHYPCEQKLKQIFPSLQVKEEQPNKTNQSQTPILVEEDEEKTVKKTKKFTPKKNESIDNQETQKALQINKVQHQVNIDDETTNKVPKSKVKKQPKPKKQKNQNSPEENKIEQPLGNKNQLEKTEATEIIDSNQQAKQ